MKVILVEKYKKLGNVGDQIEVKGGFARNFLIPNGKAIQATKSNVTLFEEKKAELMEDSKKKEAEAQKLAKKVKDKIVNVVKQAGDDGRLYGAVNSAEIADGLNAICGTDISRKQVVLNYSIKFIGVYQIDVDLGEGVLTEIFMNVARSEGEAEENARKFKSGEMQLTTANTDLVSKASAVRAETDRQEEGEAAAKPAEAPAAEAETAETAAAE